jgi:hypothetical protein
MTIYQGNGSGRAALAGRTREDTMSGGYADALADDNHAIEVKPSDDGYISNLRYSALMGN